MPATSPNLVRRYLRAGANPPHIDSGIILPSAFNLRKSVKEHSLSVSRPSTTVSDDMYAAMFAQGRPLMIAFLDSEKIATWSDKASIPMRVQDDPTPDDPGHCLIRLVDSYDNRKVPSNAYEAKKKLLAKIANLNPMKSYPVGQSSGS